MRRSEEERIANALNDALNSIDVRSLAARVHAEVMETAFDRFKHARDEFSQVTAIVERIMTQHWDMKACECWVCQEGRAAGCRPRDEYLERYESGVPNVAERRARVRVEGER